MLLVMPISHESLPKIARMSHSSTALATANAKLLSPADLTDIKGRPGSDYSLASSRSRPRAYNYDLDGMIRSLVSHSDDSSVWSLDKSAGHAAGKTDAIGTSNRSTCAQVRTQLAQSVERCTSRKLWQKPAAGRKASEVERTTNSFKMTPNFKSTLRNSEHPQRESLCRSD